MTTKYILAAALTLVAVTVPAAQAAVPKNNTSTQTLRQLVRNANQIADYAVQVNHLPNASQNPEFTAIQLDGIRTAVNDSNQVIAELRAQSATLTPAERVAVEQVAGLLHDTAVTANQAIRFYNEQRNGLWTSKYLGYNNQIRVGAEDIAKTVKTALKAGNANNQVASN